MADTDPKNHSSSSAPPSSSSSSSGVPSEIRTSHSNNHGSNQFTGHKHKAHFPNPPDAVNPDAATLRDQWRFAIKQYSRWYSHAWGTAILAGAAFFALGWVVKGGNPLPSFRSEESSPANSSDSEKPR